MIQKFVYGDPIQTGATVLDFIPSTGSVSYLTPSNHSTVFSYQMDSADIIYGLGENVRGINKRGWIYKSNCSDDPHHSESSTSLYAAHNFLMIDGKEKFAFFFDCPGTITFDVGYTHADELLITLTDTNYKLFQITGASCNEIVKEFRKLIGTSYIAPKWALGYGQSRWSYMDATEVSEIVSLHRKHHIPLDSVYLDIDYMERYKDFTINTNSFPDFSKFTATLKEEGIHLVPIIDAGVKIEEGYETYEEGVKQDYFCKREDGSNFVAGVWPGKVHFPDFLNSSARSWFGAQYKKLLDQGIEGFWNDMNEPAIFYSEEHLEEVLETLGTYKGKNLDLDLFQEFTGTVKTISNNEEDYKRFYHNMDGHIVRHDHVHNLYGYMMTRSAGEAFELLEPEKRILLFSRSSYIGMHRYGGIWTGDNKSWWSHLLLNIKMMPSLNMCGILYTGADLGGFGEDATEDLLLRWLEFGLFTPLMRNHSCIATRRQEAFRFDNLDHFRNIIGLRYVLLPYLYSEYMKASIQDELYFQPLAFAYPDDPFCKQVEDQLLVGESIMIAPVYTQNATGRYVYLPERMMMIHFQSGNAWKSTMLEAGHHYVEIALEEVVLFLRPGHILPLSFGGECVKDTNFHNLKLLYIQGDSSSYLLYDDDGYGKDYSNPDHYTTISIHDKNEVSIIGNPEITATAQPLF